jgi:hypothetical protein
MFAFFVNGVLVNVVTARGVGIQGNLLSAHPGATGSVTFFPTDYTDITGFMTKSNVMLPAWWRFFWTTGSAPPDGCQGLSKDFNIDSTGGFLCQFVCQIHRVTVEEASQYSMDTEGNVIYTGGSDKLMPYEILYHDEWRDSADGHYRLYYQADGNLVLLDMNSVTPIWHSGTAGTEPGTVTMQGDGNLVIEDASSNIVWSSNTWGNEGSVLVVQSDGNVVIYREDGTAVWQTGTGG